MRSSRKEHEEFRDDLKAKVYKGQALRKLNANPEFKELILNGYIDSTVKDCVSRLQDHLPGTTEHVKLTSKLDAVSRLSGYLSDVFSTAEESNSRLEELEDELSQYNGEYDE